MTVLILPNSQVRIISLVGEAAYPNECCGILFGRDIDNRRLVEFVEPVENDFTAGEQSHRFSIAPKTLLMAEKKCTHGLSVLGFYHSHPDHPARPSEYDRARAWPFYSYVIVSIEAKKAASLTSWVLDETSGQFFQQPVEQR